MPIGVGICCCTGQGGIIVDGCPCAYAPATLYVVTSDASKNNQIFNNCTLQYGSTPADLYDVVHSDYSYLSTATFDDPALGVPFSYLLVCSIGAYLLTRVYVTSPIYSPFIDIDRYSWTIGFPGNVCTPFSCMNGQIFQGGDASEVVTVTG